MAERPQPPDRRAYSRFGFRVSEALRAYFEGGIGRMQVERDILIAYLDNPQPRDAKEGEYMDAGVDFD